MALGVALLRAVVPHRQLGAAIGWNALAVALSSAAGPAIGAMILSGLGWHWLFALNLPLGGAVLLAARALPRRGGTGRRLDRLSVALNAGAFAALVLGADLLLEKPLAAAALLAVGGFVLTALVRREMPKDAPMIPLDLLRAMPFRISVVASVCCFAGTTAGLMALPFHLQHGLGQDAFTAGLCMTPWPLTVALVAPLAGRIAERVSTAWLCAAGGALVAVGLAIGAVLALAAAIVSMARARPAIQQPSGRRHATPHAQRLSSRRLSRSSSWSASTGLVRCAKKPASKLSWRSRSCP
jgi:DHA2 family multidrug resistance protein-like MFS transporter